MSHTFPDPAAVVPPTRLLPGVGRIIHVHLAEGLDCIPAIVTGVLVEKRGPAEPGIYAMLFPAVVGGAPRGIRLPLTEGERRERAPDESMFDGAGYRWYWPPGAHR